MEYYSDNKYLKFLGERFFELCSTRRKGIGGRISLDTPIKELFKKEIPELKELSPQAMKVKLTIGKEIVNFGIKCDGAFQIGGRYIFYEVKNYGDNTNDILSAITAAQLIREIPEYKNSLIYYIGVNSSKKNIIGLRREDFFKKERIKISPYVKWAENKGFLKFYGIVDIGDLLKEVKEASVKI